ncbi:hypothetical protein [Armatimonas sp.]|uniref:hypothetical protein n=1 Tax=Armatimonas sp. TaxID=1872638 RepID=UPI003751008E
MDETKKTNREPGALNYAQVVSLDVAAQIAAAARKPAYHATLLARGITDETLDALDTAVSEGKKEQAAAVESDTGQWVSTSNEKLARKELLAGLREVQTAARQKWTRTQPAALKGYYIGENLPNMSRATLVQVTEGILLRLSTQTLPGITPETITALAAKRDTYVEANQSQLGFIAGAKARREAALEHLKTATDLRIEVQFAADAAYPFDNPKSAPARTEFALPPNRRFVTR